MIVTRPPKGTTIRIPGDNKPGPSCMTTLGMYLCNRPAEHQPPDLHLCRDPDGTVIAIATGEEE